MLINAGKSWSRWPLNELEFERLCFAELRKRER
jgi:hypothetical protein